jgi:carbon monoxide dehydrogenase subunit G
VVRIDLSVAVERPPHDVFDFLSDVERLPEWQSSAVESRAEGPLAAGTRIHERRRILGREVASELEVTAYEPPHRLTIKALSGPLRFTVEHTFVQNGGGTAVRVVAEADPGTLMKLAEPMLARTAEEELRKDLARLKALLEAD